MLIALYALAATWTGHLRTRMARRLASDAGFSTLEWVVIALGVFLAAGIAVAAISGAISNRVGQIN
ncbi:MAG: hypothetical protein KDC39_10965 [Actinobacteria bacterium]|nr:hypothetical protein [Actinomycetota bacterium]